jgi:retron-type reverse transcriptase
MSQKHIVKDWYDIEWHSCYSKVAQMQHEIVVAYKNMERKKIAELQYNLVNSFSARAIAAKTVATINKGKKTPGVDDVAALTPDERIKLVQNLTEHRKIKPLPVRRV